MIEFMKIKAFMLIEAIFSVFITMLIVLILQNLVVNLNSSQKLGHPVNEAAYAYVQLERFLDDGTSYTEPSASNSLRSVFVKINKKGKRTHYVIEQYQDMIRVTGTSTGHMPLLLGVKRASFKTKGKQILIKVIEKDGRKSDLLFKLEKRPSREDQDEEES